MLYIAIHVGQYTLENTGQKTNHKQKKTQKMQTKQNTSKQNHPDSGSVASYDTRPGNEVGLIDNAPEPTRNRLKLESDELRRLVSNKDM